MLPALNFYILDARSMHNHIAHYFSYLNVKKGKILFLSQTFHKSGANVFKVSMKWKNIVIHALYCLLKIDIASLDSVKKGNQPDRERGFSF